jgi:diaminopimelate decarboxylase
MQTKTTLADRLSLFPDSTSIEDDSLFIGGLSLASLAADHGTPYYLYDRLTLDNAVEEYRSALQRHYPAPARITYAGKAFLCKAIAEWTQTEDLLVDCTGEGEIAMALAGGVPRQNILVHGVNKSKEDIRSALQHAGTIVVDNLIELHHIHVILLEGHQDGVSDPQERRISSATGETLRFAQSDIDLWLRLLPGLAVHTHHTHTQTGQHDSKFGMTRPRNPGSGEVL